MKFRKAPIVFVLALLALLATTPSAYAIAAPDSPKDRLVLEAVSFLYAPIPDHRSEWVNEICERMTVGGCAYFKDRLEATLWKNGQDVSFTSVVPGGVTGTLEDGSQVWRMEVSIYRTCGKPLRKCPLIESAIYLHVVYDEAREEWLLNRVLSGPVLREW